MAASDDSSPRIRLTYDFVPSTARLRLCIEYDLPPASPQMRLTYDFVPSTARLRLCTEYDSPSASLRVRLRPE
uniref:Uncharacterized protein n=1 Tax=Acrobeloides nanus TaxID=290746 RepID=A0A914DBE2_9BILA